MRYLMFTVAVLGGLFFWHQFSSTAVPIEVAFEIPVVKEDFGAISLTAKPAAPAPKPVLKQNAVVEIAQAVDEEAFVAQLQEQFRYIAELPGAHDLAWDIRDALIDNPEAFDMSAITEGPENLLKANYLEHMIPDPNLREKWVALMDIVVNSIPGE
ncbi:MAG: hypothetical protein R3B54_06250 [Bdellovibrionota bacterium]